MTVTIVDVETAVYGTVAVNQSVEVEKVIYESIAVEAVNGETIAVGSVLVGCETIQLKSLPLKPRPF